MEPNPVDLLYEMLCEDGHIALKWEVVGADEHDWIISWISIQNGPMISINQKTLEVTCGQDLVGYLYEPNFQSKLSEYVFTTTPFWLR